MLPSVEVLKSQGIKLPFVAASRVLQYCYCSWIKRGTFSFMGRSYPYFYHLHNATFRTERTVEIPIVLGYLKPGLKVLEVGNVLSHYTPCHHDVLDKYEVAPGVINEDIVDFQPGKEYDLIVSISTLEHVGWDEDPKDAGKIPRAVAHIKTLLKPGGLMVVTLPLGYNSVLDGMFEANELGFTEVGYLKRISKDNRWKEVPYAEVKGARYGEPFMCSNAIALAVYKRQALPD